MSITKQNSEQYPDDFDDFDDDDDNDSFSSLAKFNDSEKENNLTESFNHSNSNEGN